MNFNEMALPELEKARAELAREARVVFDHAEGDLAKMSDDDVAKVEDLTKRMNEVGDLIDRQSAMAAAREKAEQYGAVEEKAGKRPEQPTAPEAKQVPGDLFDTDAMKRFADNPAVGISMDVDASRFTGYRKNALGMLTKATLGTDATGAGVDTIYPPEVIRESGMVDVLFQDPNISDLFPNVPTTQNAVAYMVETVTSEGAAEVVEGSAAAEAQISFAESTADIKKIRVLMPVTEEALADIGGLRAHVNSRLGTFVRNREDLQLLKGDGTGENLTGINNTGSIQNQNISLTGLTGQLYAEAIHNGLTLVRESFLTPTAMVMSAATWEFLRLTKDGNDNYLFAGISDAGVARVWGLPVVVNQRQSDHDTNTNIGVTVVAREAAAVHRRMAVTVDVAREHSTDFAEGIITFRATERVGLTVYRPAGICTITSVT